MKCDVSSIKVLDDAVALVRQRPEMFVGVGEVQPEFLATSLAHDALALGVRQVEIHHIDEWWAVVSEEDWLTYHNGVGVRETFNRILPIPGSVNGCRSEVVVHALAAAVFTSKAGELVVLSGDEGVARSALARGPLCHIGNKRIVAFAMPEGHATEECSNSADRGGPQGPRRRVG
jgi:hypothetical protein